MELRRIEGKLDAKGLKFALIASRFNDFIVDKLISGALDCLTRHGADPKDLTLVRVPGAFETPLAAKKLAASGKYDGILCLGAVIRGATPHFEFVAGECAKGVAMVGLETGVPLGFGVLTCDTLEQAIERAGSKAGNKGVEAAQALIETIRVLEQI
ncbi:MAG: 6,7-dimethyl-8-ribityllumazine synthase [Desulfovibrionaceae bacterium]|nr:6,7-dimethyl-8-ribityllumazine synthase [Desulfovibrionaceae bacterium]